MADVDDGHSFRTKLPDHLEQSIRFTIRESRRRFIHHQHSALVEERPRDLDLLLFGHRQMCRALRGLEPGAQPIQHFLGLPIHFGRICHKAETFQFRAQKDVAAHRQVRRNRQFLVDDADPCQARFVRRP